MADWSADENPYDVLGLPFGCSRDELKKKYRRLVLEKHPDKQPGNKRAAEEFIKIQRAYEILTDDKAKEAFDALERARAARQAKQAGQTEKRRKMAEDLERRERAFEAERQQERQARSRLNEELARLRKEMADRRAAEEAARLRERVQASLAGAAPSQQQPGAGGLEGEVQRTLKASWDPAASAYTEERLRGIFAAHGAVEDVILRQPKRRGKHSALVVMRDLQGAQAAAAAVSGDLENPLLVVPLAKVPVAGQPPPEQAQLRGHAPSPVPGASRFPSATAPGSNGAASSLFPGVARPPQGGKPAFAAFASAGANGSAGAAAAAAPSGDSAHSKFESSILEKMRQKAEAAKRAREGAAAPTGDG